jgi:catechol 2,3-dioxygenase
MNAKTETSRSAKTEFSIHPETKLEFVSLTVSNLDSQILFYQQTLGFILYWRDGNRAGLGAGGVDILQLTEQAYSKRYQHVTGLYHFAIVFPDRRELARVTARLFALKYRNYPTDHIMTKSTYLNDPEGNGIELYAESPEDGMFTIENGDFVTRRSDGSLSDGREALDLEALFSHLLPDDRLDDPIPPETHLGHMHLHVRDVEEAVEFYHGVLGFDLMGISKTFQAAFVSAGGYHHHIGLNSWQGAGAPPPPDGALGLRYFTVILPEKKALDEVMARIENAGIPYNQTNNGFLVYDPSQNGVVLTIQ